LNREKEAFFEVKKHTLVYLTRKIRIFLKGSGAEECTAEVGMSKKRFL
jgi:hypothetical protein